jgi:hypothetical protein
MTETLQPGGIGTHDPMFWGRVLFSFKGKLPEKSEIYNLQSG